MKYQRTNVSKFAIMLAAVFALCWQVSAQSISQNASPGTGIIAVDPYGFDDRITQLDGDEIRFVTSYDYPPFVFVRRDGRLGGWDIELAQNICRMLQKKCSLQQVPFEDLGRYLIEEKADVGISGLRISTQAGDFLNFTEPYLRQGGRFVVRTSFADSDVSPKDSKDLRIGVAAGTVHEKFLKTYFKRAIIIPFPQQQDAQNALSGRQIDAVFGDAMAISFWLNGRASGNCCKFAGDAYIMPEFFGDGLAMAVKSGNSKLIAALNASLARMARDGVLSALYLKYFPISYM